MTIQRNRHDMRIAFQLPASRQVENQSMSGTRVDPWRVCRKKKNPEHSYQLPPCFLPLLRVSTRDGLKTYLVQSQWTSSFIASVCVSPSNWSEKQLYTEEKERAKMQGAKETAANAVASAKHALPGHGTGGHTTGTHATSALPGHGTGGHTTGIHPTSALPGHGTGGHTTGTHATSALPGHGTGGQSTAGKVIERVVGSHPTGTNKAGTGRHNANNY
jgi:hypothetical protein